MIDHVFCQANTTVATGDGVPLRLQMGEHWPASDPIVTAHPDLFTPDPRYGMRYSVPPLGWDAPVEAATAAPGERRSTARSGRS